MVQIFQIITINLSKTSDNKQSLKIYLDIGWKKYQCKWKTREKLLGKVSKLRKRSGNSLLFLIEIFTPETAAHQIWHILRVVLESNPGRAGHIDFVSPSLIPGRRKVCTNFDELQFWSPLRYRDVLYSFEKFQYLSKWF